MNVCVLQRYLKMPPRCNEPFITYVEWLLVLATMLSVGITRILGGINTSMPPIVDATYPAIQRLHLIFRTESTSNTLDPFVFSQGSTFQSSGGIDWIKTFVLVAACLLILALVMVVVSIFQNREKPMRSINDPNATQLMSGVSKQRKGGVHHSSYREERSTTSISQGHSQDKVADDSTITSTPTATKNASTKRPTQDAISSGGLDQQIQYFAKIINRLIEDVNKLHLLINQDATRLDQIQNRERAVEESMRKVDANLQEAKRTKEQAGNLYSKAERLRKEAIAKETEAIKARDQAKEYTKQAVATYENIRESWPTILRDKSIDENHRKQVKQRLLRDMQTPETKEATRRFWGALMFVEDLDGQDDITVVSAVNLLSWSLLKYPGFNDAENVEIDSFVRELIEILRNRYEMKITRYRPGDPVNYGQMKLIGGQHRENVVRVHSWYIERGTEKIRALVEA